jgi:hypothetical protein
MVHPECLAEKSKARTTQWPGSTFPHETWHVSTKSIMSAQNNIMQMPESNTKHPTPIIQH